MQQFTSLWGDVDPFHNFRVLVIQCQEDTISRNTSQQLPPNIRHADRNKIQKSFNWNKYIQFLSSNVIDLIFWNVSFWSTLELYWNHTSWHECSPVNLPHIFRTSFHKNTSAFVIIFDEFSKCDVAVFESNFDQNSSEHRRV